MQERVVSADSLGEEAGLEVNLRPQSLGDFVGQKRIKDNLAVAVQAARQRGEPPDHILFYGPPGLGKTTLAHIMAHETGVNLRVTSGPAIERPGDLASILTSLRPGDILFVDEVHRLPRQAEEMLYPVLEDFVLDIVIGKGPGARNVRLAIPKFTMIGATTRYAMISPPLRDRFGTVHRLDFYDLDDMAAIVARAAAILGVSIDEGGGEQIARRSRRTPRVANRLLRWSRDYAQVMADGVITADIAKEALERIEVDELGLDKVDHELLRAMIEKFGGGPVGLETIAATVAEEADTIMDVYEPYLMQIGLLQRTPRGRVVTRFAYEHLGIEQFEMKKPPQSTLWEISNKEPNLLEEEL